MNVKAIHFDHFFKSQPLGEKKITNLVQDACSKNGIKGVGPKGHVNFHGAIRGTMTSLLVQSGIPDSSTVLRNGHRQIDSIRPYYTIRGKEGRQQQYEIFGGADQNHELREGYDTEALSDPPSRHI